MTSYVITVEGVLRKLLGQPLTEGIEFVRALVSERDSVVFLIESEDTKDAEEFLDRNGLRHDFILGRAVERPQQLHAIRHQWGYGIDVVIEPDPAVCAELVGEGFFVLGFFHPYFARAEWRPGYKPAITPWADLVQQVIDDTRDNQVFGKEAS
jgi:hypothetical protein